MAKCADCGQARSKGSEKLCRVCYRLRAAMRRQQPGMTTTKRNYKHEDEKWTPPATPMARAGFCQLCGVVRLSVALRDGVCDGCAEWEREKEQYQPYKRPAAKGNSLAQ